MRCVPTSANNAVKFDIDISSWNVSNVTDMSSMFEKANTFDKDISSWDVSNVDNMDRMFFDTNNFSGDLSGWAVKSGVSHTDFDTNNGSGLKPPNW